MRSGANDRTGFIDAPLSGLDHNPARAIYAPTATADSAPTFCALDAVPRMTLTKPMVSTASTSIARISPTPGAGTVAPSMFGRPATTHRKRHASTPPTIWATTYPGTLRHGNSERSANARLTTGLR